MRTEWWKCFLSCVADRRNYAGYTFDGTRVVHLHGFWFGTDTLHASIQVGHPRPKLRQSLLSLINDALLVVLGYGGWDDTMMATIEEALLNDHAKPDIAWAFYGRDEAEIVDSHRHVTKRLSHGIARGRVNLYLDCDVSRFLPQLRDRLVNGNSHSIGEPHTERLPAESLQRFLDIIAHRFFWDRHVQDFNPSSDIGEETQQLQAWGDPIPVIAALQAATHVVHLYENSLPHSPRERDDREIDFWPRRCLDWATQWLFEGKPPPEDERVMWPSVWHHCRQGRHSLDVTIVDAVQYACEAVALLRGETLPNDPAVTSFGACGPSSALRHARNG